MRWHDWATKHRYSVCALRIFFSGSVLILCFAVERVPITGRRQLDLIPNWVAVGFDEHEREGAEELRGSIKNFSLNSDHPAMQIVNLVFSRLVRASRLDDRNWDLRVVHAPGEQALTQYLCVHESTPNLDTIAEKLVHTFSIFGYLHVISCARVNILFISVNVTSLFALSSIYLKTVNLEHVIPVSLRNVDPDLC